MKHANWFICLSYPLFDILIPKEDVLSSSYTSSADSGNDKKIINIDTLIDSSSAYTTNTKNKTRFEISGKQNTILQTSIIPDLISADLSEFKVFGDKLGKALLRTGFISIRFTDKKVQYLIDVKAIIKKGIKK